MCVTIPLLLPDRNACMHVRVSAEIPDTLGIHRLLILLLDERMVWTLIRSRSEQILTQVDTVYCTSVLYHDAVWQRSNMLLWWCHQASSCRLIVHSSAAKQVHLAILQFQWLKMRCRVVADLWTVSDWQFGCGYLAKLSSSTDKGDPITEMQYGGAAL